MSAPANPTHTHFSEYAEPLLRAASPASSVGTEYHPDQTSFSDSEQQLSDTAFDQKCMDRVALDTQRWEELKAEIEPLLTVSVAGSKPVRITEKKLEPHEEKLIFERIMSSLKAEVERLREDELFDQILLRGSNALLEPQPTTNDIDSLMRGMMGPSMNISGPHMGKAIDPSKSGPGGGPKISNGPWNNYGQTTEPELPESTLPANPSDSILSGTTAGKRSRNGTRRKL